MNGANWSTGVVPGSATQAIIDNGGTAVVTLGGAVTTASEIDIGNNATGALILNSGVISDVTVNFGNNAGSSLGTATVNSGIWSTSGNFTVGTIGAGNLVIGGGLVSDQNAFIGLSAGSSGTATISGGVWSSLSTLYVGFSGAGTLNINGGRVSDQTGVIAFNGALGSSLSGNAASYQGVVNVSGGTWSNSGDLYVGYAGPGALNVSNGYVSDNNAFVGQGGIGMVTVSGGTWNNSGGLYVGGLAGSGSDVLNITGSGVVIAGGGIGTVTLGSQAGSPGILNIGNGGVFTGSLEAATVTGGAGSGAVNFSESGSMTFAPALTGNLSVNQIGSGTTVLTGASSYTGGTTISAGALQIGNGSTAGSITGNIVDNATLIYDHSDNISPGGNITGSGSVVQAGTGTLTFNGSQTYSYTGQTQVLAGTLFLDPVQLSTSLVTIAPGATLSGAGSIAGNLVNAGLVEPQSLISVGGNFSNLAGGVLLITITGTSAFDAIHIGGKAALGGTLQVLAAPGYKPQVGNKFKVLTAAGGVTGKFATITQSGYFGVLYDPNDVTLFINQALGSPTVTLSADTRQVLSGIMGDTLLQWKQLTLSNAEVLDDTVNNRVAALRDGSQGFTNYGLGGTPLPQAQDPSKSDGKAGTFFAPAPENRWSGWSAGNGTFAHVINLDSLPGFRSETGSVFAGADYRILDNLAVGVFGGYQYNFAKFSGGSQLDSNGARFGLYSVWNHGGFWASALAAGGFDNYQLFRATGAGTTAKSSPEGSVIQSQAATGYDWKLGNLTLGVNTALQYSWLSVGGYNEGESTGLAANVGSQNVNSLRTNLGATASYKWKIAPNWSLVPSMGAAWQYELLDGTTTIPVQLQGLPGYSYGVTVAAGDRNTLIASAGLGLVWKDLATLSFGYLLQQSANVTSETVQAQISIAF